MYKNKIIAGPTLYVESVSCGEDWCLGVEGTHPLTWKNKYNSSSHLFELMCNIQFVITLTCKLHLKIILKAKRKKWKNLGDNLLNLIFFLFLLTCVWPPEPGDGEADALAAQLAPDADPGVLQHLEAVSGDDLPVLGPRDHAPIWKLRKVFSFFTLHA